MSWINSRVAESSFATAVISADTACSSAVLTSITELADASQSEAGAGSRVSMQSRCTSEQKRVFDISVPVYSLEFTAQLQSPKAHLLECISSLHCQRLCDRPYHQYVRSMDLRTGRWSNSPSTHYHCDRARLSGRSGCGSSQADTLRRIEPRSRSTTNKPNTK